MKQTLARTGVSSKEVNSLSIEDGPEPISSIEKLRNALINPFRARKSSDPAIQIWPSIGLLEPLLWLTKSATSHTIILHDPEPIRKQVGFDPFSRGVVRYLGTHFSPRILVHSADAMKVAEKLYPKLRIDLALHPVLSNMVLSDVHSRTIVVAGQFKPERNLDLLATLGPKLRAYGWRPRIYGRGWPTEIPGWEVENRFLTEAELDTVIDGAAVILIPYNKYFQSGIAIRALERGRPVVAKQNSFTEEIFGGVSGSTYDDSATADDIVELIENASSSEYNPIVTFQRYRDKVDLSWRRFSYSI